MDLLKKRNNDWFAKIKIYAENSGPNETVNTVDAVCFRRRSHELTQTNFDGILCAEYVCEQNRLLLLCTCI